MYLHLADEIRVFSSWMSLVTQPVTVSIETRLSYITAPRRVLVFVCSGSECLRIMMCCDASWRGDDQSICKKWARNSLSVSIDGTVQGRVKQMQVRKLLKATHSLCFPLISFYHCHCALVQSWQRQRRQCLSQIDHVSAVKNLSTVA